MLCLCGAGVIFASQAQGVELESVKASRLNQHYVVELVMLVSIPESYARSILLDPDRVVSVNQELVNVQHLPSDEEGVSRFRDHTRACIWLFCVDYHNTLNMRVKDNGDIHLMVEPATSKFEYGKFVWRTQAVDTDRTRLEFFSETRPGFWVPSVGMLKARMKQGLRRMAVNMQCEYRGDQVCAESVWVDSTSQ